MVRDGYYYGAVLLIAGFLVGWLAAPGWSIPCLFLAAFFLWFFRDPERLIPDVTGAIVSPADGTVKDISAVLIDGRPRTRISIFLNVFDVHVNRSPITATIRDVHYRKGKYLNAMNEACAEQNEQNIITFEGEGQTVFVKQIAGLLARRIVFSKKVGEVVRRGERIGLIKFGSRTDVLVDPAARLDIKKGDRVKGGSSVLAYFHPVADSAMVSTLDARETR
ncbi:MAG: phosphatidylserine decarboxylase [Acidobacteria bacterium]|nr:phosphatidylserine decarboxylase [Acidobacteriota bacterium]MBV9482442.1 phosphatidylserine decarboxylase [Acidobacteriota bacterium]